MTNISSVFDQFQESFQTRSKVQKGYVSQNTIKTYNRIWNEFIISLSSSPPPPLEEVTTEQVLSFLEHLRKRGLSSTSVSLYLSCLSSVFKFADRKYGIPDISRNIGPIRKQPREIKCLTKEQLENFLNFLRKDKKAQKRDLMLFELMMRTGPRVSEISSLNLTNVRITDELISVTYLGKGNKPRTIDIPVDKHNKEIRRFKRRLEHYLSHYRKSWEVNPGREGAFFLSIRGNRVSIRAIQKAFKYYMKKLNLPDCGVHALRHSFVTNMLAAGTDIATVSKLVGHANPDITYKIYAHTDPEKMKKAMEASFKILQHPSDE